MLFIAGFILGGLVIGAIAADYHAAILGDEQKLIAALNRLKAKL